MPKVSIVILTFNSIKFIKSCLESLFAQDYNSFEVIVIDNGSIDDTVTFVKEHYPRVKLIENERNFGACKARNQGIEICKGEWILTLDCDITLKKDFLNKITDLVKESEKSIGMFQPKILNMDKKTIYSCGIYLSNLRRFYDIGKGEFENGQFSASSRYIFGVCSAAALYKKEMLEDIEEKTGYFDERFFFLVEDVDLSWRAQKRGWGALFYPEAICYHIGNSSDTSKQLRQYLCWRNRKLLLRKCQLNRFKLAIISFFYGLPRLGFLFLANPYVRNEVLNGSVGDITSLQRRR